MVKGPPANAGDTRVMGSIPGLGRSPGGGNGSPLQHSCLENPVHGRAWWAIVPGVTKSQARPGDCAFLHLALTVQMVLKTQPRNLNSLPSKLLVRNKDGLDGFQCLVSLLFVQYLTVFPLCKVQ